ncbi:MAG TPA: cupin domain-containing protein [Roseiflexaceae bacterium]|nr:cupin domain-containing protein [Roseiflexaceae bacterium]
MDTITSIPPFPSAVGVTHLRVYDTVTPDGLIGGSPHVHFVCTELYIVVGGRGSVQTLSTEGYRETALEPGKLVWFTPGTIHRLVNDGDLEIQIVMQNAGLPEAGDAVLTFPIDVMADPRAYFDAASLAPSGHVYASSEQAAYHRRDLAVEGFNTLRQRFEERGPAALDAFYRAALKLVQPKLDAWCKVWEQGPLAATQQTGEQFDALQQGRIDHLRDGAIYELPAPCEQRRLGMCGTLGLYLPEGVLK